jgi:hypothetical protein
LERLAAKGIKPEEAMAPAKTDKPADPFKERKLDLSSKLRDIIGALPISCPHALARCCTASLPGFAMSSCACFGRLQTRWTPV